MQMRRAMCVKTQGEAAGRGMRVFEGGRGVGAGRRAGEDD